MPPACRFYMHDNYTTQQKRCQPFREVKNEDSTRGFPASAAGSGRQKAPGRVHRLSKDVVALFVFWAVLRPSSLQRRYPQCRD
jgi:hypothetical protein